MDDFYKKLQVDPSAELEVIRAAYYALARKYHPDMGGEARRMAELNAAWGVLGSPLLRSTYDAGRAELGRQPEAAAHVDAAADPGPALVDYLRRTRPDSSSTLDFGRYAGWSLEQVVERDPDYLEWLVRTPVGRRLSAEAIALLKSRTAPPSAVRAGHRDPRGGSAGRQHGGQRFEGWHWFGRSRQGCK